MKKLAFNVLTSSPCKKTTLTSSLGSSSLLLKSLLIGSTHIQTTNNTQSLFITIQNNSNSTLIKNYHTTTHNLFFDLKKAKQQATEAAVFSEQEKAELIKNYQVLEDKFKQLTEMIIEFRRNHPVPVQMESNHLQVEICNLVNYCYLFFPKQTDPARIYIRFYNSNVGMKCYVLMKKLELLLLKAVSQEWFSIEALRSQFDQLKILQPLCLYPEQVPVDETYYLYAVYDAQLAYAAYTPQLTKDMVRPVTKENLIAGCLFLFNRVKDCPVLNNELRSYANSLFTDYENAKIAYTTAAKSVSENSEELHYNAHQNPYSYLGKSFSENEFNWFEDLETNIPIHLGNFLKALKVVVDFDVSDKTQGMEILDECIKFDPKNIYLHYLKGSCLDIVNSSVPDITLVHNNYSTAIHHLEKALAYLSTAPMLPLPTISKTNFAHESEEQEKHVERINDLKFTPISLILANMYARAAESGVSAELRHLYGGKGVDFVRQTELYSRFPNLSVFYMVKGACYYSCDMFELSINAYSAVEQFESVLDPSYIIDSLTYASNGMIALGFSDKCIEAMDFYIEKYNNDPRLLFQKILCKDYMSRSKDELRQVKQEFEQLQESIADLQLTNPYVFARVHYQTEAKIAELGATISNPQVAEQW